MKSFTSESVTPGHPDKVCDQISDAVLDEYLRQDPEARTAVEVLADSRGIVVAGEVGAGDVDVDVEAVVREVLRKVGYTMESGLDPESVPVDVRLVPQSKEIAAAVLGGPSLGAGDQGHVFGYACDETAERMPAPAVLANALTRRLVAVREQGVISALRPDGKSQVTVTYSDDGRPASIESVLVSTQYAPSLPLHELRSLLIEEVIVPVVDGSGLPTSDGLKVLVNPSGAWHHGGPGADTGLTGRKIIVDTYGGMARHGGGAFSGKDPSKVDRSGAYAARQAAKAVVASGRASRCEIQVAYAIGVAEPVAVRVETFGTGQEPDEQIARWVRDVFDLTPGGIIERLRLRRPMYEMTAAFGHFGDPTFPWEQV